LVGEVEEEGDGEEEVEGGIDLQHVVHGNDVAVVFLGLNDLVEVYDGGGESDSDCEGCQEGGRGAAVEVCGQLLIVQTEDDETGAELDEAQHSHHYREGDVQLIVEVGRHDIEGLLRFHLVYLLGERHAQAQH
jgi:hypothetical protein